MKTKIYSFSLDLSWNLIQQFSQLDRFDAQWNTIEKREGQSLKQLKSIATVRSVGASTRIEGSRMTNEEVEVLLNNLKISKLEERDQQEVAGYFEVLDLLGESYDTAKSCFRKCEKTKIVMWFILVFGRKLKWLNGLFQIYLKT